MQLLVRNDFEGRVLSDGGLRSQLRQAGGIDHRERCAALLDVGDGDPRAWLHSQLARWGGTGVALTQGGCRAEEEPVGGYLDSMHARSSLAIAADPGDPKLCESSRIASYGSAIHCVAMAHGGT